MHLLKASVNGERLTQTPSGSLPREHTANGFLPFENERDHIGRLIKVPFPPKRSRSLKSSKVSFEKQPALLQSKIHKYFKQNNCDDIYQTSKNKIAKRTIINLMTEEVSLYQKNRNTPHKKQWVKTIRETIEVNPQFARTTDSRKFKNFSTDKKTVQRIQSSATQKHSTLHQISSNELSSQKLPFQRSVSSKEQKSYRQYPELHRFVQMQSLQMKTLDNFEESHLKFLTKMKESKQLAFELRHNIEHIDY